MGGRYGRRESVGVGGREKGERGEEREKEKENIIAIIN